MNDTQLLEATQWGNLKVLSENKTDASGRFELPNRPSREYILGVSAEGYSSASINFLAQPGLEPSRIQLKPEQPLRGRVVDASGKSQPEAAVTVVDYMTMEGLGFVWSGKTDSEGRFVWRGAPTNELQFAVTKAPLFRLLRLTASTNEQIIVLGEHQSKIRITGNVFDVESKVPVENFEAKIILKNDDKIQIVTGAAGKFEYELAESDFNIGNMPSWILQIEADGFKPLKTRQYVFEEGDQHLELEMQRGGTIEGIVETPTGVPAANAQLGFSTERGIHSAKPGDLMSFSNDKQHAQKDGRFKLKKKR